MSWMFRCSGSVVWRGCAGVVGRRPCWRAAGLASQVVVTASAAAAAMMLDVCQCGTGDAMPDVCQWRCGKAPLALGAIGLGTVPGSGGCVVVVGGGRERDAHECREVPV